MQWINMVAGLQSFEINLDNPDGIYAPGDVVSGQVIIELENQIDNIKAIRIKFEGKAKAAWQEHQSYRSAEEKYINMKFDLYTSTEDKNMDFHTGHHTFPFSFALPQAIPSSFQHQGRVTAKVKYSLEATIVRPWKFDHNTKRPIRIVTPLNLSSSLLALRSINEEDRKVFCCPVPCIQTGTAIYRISLPSNAFIPGEWIKASVYLDTTATTVKVTKVKLILKQKLKFRERGMCETTTKEDVVVDVTEERGPFPSIIDVILRLQIPNLPASYLKYCNIIHVEYWTQIFLNFSGCHRRVKKKFETVIGTCRDDDNRLDNIATAPIAVSSSP